MVRVRKYDSLVDAAEVAQILGLGHRNSVATYARRYADFPEPVVVRAAGRTRLWERADILAWVDRSNGRGARRDGALGPDATRAKLVNAARSIMARRPVSDISIREIGAAAGVPHTLIYRYFGSKQELRDAVLDQVTTELSEAFAGIDFEPADMAGVAAGVLANSAGVMVLVRALLDGDADALTVGSPPVVDRLKQGALRRQAASGEAANADQAQLVAAATAALLVGWVVINPRLPAGINRQELESELGRIASAILDLG